MDSTDLLDELCSILDCPRDAEALKAAAKRAKAARDLMPSVGCRLRELTRSYENRWGQAFTADFHHLIKQVDDAK